MLGKDVLHVPVALGGRHGAAHGSVEAAAVRIGAGAAQIDLNTALLARAAPRGEEDDGDERHDDRHDEHVVHAEELRVATERSLKVRGDHAEGDSRQPRQHASMSTAMEPMANHSERCTPASTFSAFWATPASLPSHLAQKKKVAAEPKASRMRKTTLPVSANETSVAHLEMSMQTAPRTYPGCRAS